MKFRDLRQIIASVYSQDLVKVQQTSTITWTRTVPASVLRRPRGTSRRRISASGWSTGCRSGIRRRTPPCPRSPKRTLSDNFRWKKWREKTIFYRKMFWHIPRKGFGSKWNSSLEKKISKVSLKFEIVLWEKLFWMSFSLFKFFLWQKKIQKS